MNDKFHNDLLPYLFEGVYVVDRRRKILYWNEGSEKITGYKAEEVINSRCYEDILQHIDEHGKHLCKQGCPLKKTLVSGKINEKHIFLKHKEGHRVPVAVKSIPVYDDDNRIIAAIEVFTDERFQKDIYKENLDLKDKLTTDPLTKIANRLYFDFQLAKAREEAKRFDRTFGILIADIDHFKRVNDTYGHVVGDEILKLVSRSLVASVKKGDFISRWGGEEFVGLFEVETIEELTIIAERLRIVVENSSYDLEPDNQLFVTISLGGTLYQDKEDAESLLKRADENLYYAKNHGRNQVRVTNTP